MATQPPAHRTVGELRASGYLPRSIRDELRTHVLERLREGRRICDGVSPHAVAETMKQVRRLTRRGVTIDTFMLDDSPELLGFVEHMTQVNRGRAFFTAPIQLGSFMLVDYVNGRRKQRS